jgi:hypothetical protein
MVYYPLILFEFDLKSPVHFAGIFMNVYFIAILEQDTVMQNICSHIEHSLHTSVAERTYVSGHRQNRTAIKKVVGCWKMVNTLQNAKIHVN